MLNKEKYKKFCQSNEDMPIFSQYWWLNNVCGEHNWGVLLYEKGGHIWASMPYYIEKKYGLRLIRMPKLTQTMGPYIKYPEKQKYYKKLSWEKEVMIHFMKNLPKVSYFVQNFHHSISNWLPLYWKGFKQTTRYTYIIDNDTDIQELSKNLETDIRRRTKKAENIGVEVFESEDIEKFFELNKMTFQRQKINIPYTFDFVSNLYNNCKKHSSVKMFFAKYENEVIACNFLVYDKNTVYYLMGGIDPDKRDLGGMDAVQFESIKFALNNNKAFDFEGSMIESIEKYFRSFGALQKQYFKITKSTNIFIKIIEALR